FKFLAIRGSIWHGVKGFRSSPHGPRRIEAIYAIKMRAPVLGGNFAVFRGLVLTFDCAAIRLRQKRDIWNVMIAGLFTGSTLNIRNG
ncbi:hypothetical protein BJ170DRAFT_561380, partial [Xylariales sp. AK1849]